MSIYIYTHTHTHKYAKKTYTHIHTPTHTHASYTKVLQKEYSFAAQQHCDLFYLLGWGSDWVYHKLGNAPVLRSGTGSWVLSG